ALRNFPELILQSSWKFLNAFNFCDIFRTVLGLPRFDIYDLEAAFGANDEGDPQDQREASAALSQGSSSRMSTPVPTGLTDGTATSSAFLGEFMCRLLQHLTPRAGVLRSLEKDKRLITPAIWELHVRALLRPYRRSAGSSSSLASDAGEDDDDIDDLFPEDVAFGALPTHVKIELLKRVCDRVFEEGADVVRDVDSEEMRCAPLGIDEKGRSYWLFGETRLYREKPLPKLRKQGSTPPMEDYTFELCTSIFHCLHRYVPKHDHRASLLPHMKLARTPKDWGVWMMRFKSSRKVAERMLHEALCEIGEEVIEKIEVQLVARAREKERLEKLRLLNAMPKKRSSRIESKKKEVEEHQRAEEMRRVEAEQAEQRKAEKDRAKRERRRAEKEAIKMAEKRLDIEVRGFFKSLLAPTPTPTTPVSESTPAPDATPDFTPDTVQDTTPPPRQRVTRYGGAAIRQPSEEKEPLTLLRRRLPDDLGTAVAKLKETVALLDGDVKPRVEILRKAEEELEEFEQNGRAKVGFPELGSLKVGFDVNHQAITNPLVKSLLRDTVSLLLSQPCSDDFAVPVDVVKFKIFDYPKIIKRPMDLSTIYKKIMLDRYNGVKTEAQEANMEESGSDEDGKACEDNSRVGFIGFVADLRQIVWNCVVYNHEESSITQLARELEWLATRLLRCLFGDEEWDEEAWKNRKDGNVVVKLTVPSSKRTWEKLDGREAEKNKKRREKEKPPLMFDKHPTSAPNTTVLPTTPVTLPSTASRTYGEASSSPYFVFANQQATRPEYAHPAAALSPASSLPSSEYPQQPHQQTSFNNIFPHNGTTAYETGSGAIENGAANGVPEGPEAQVLQEQGQTQSVNESAKSWKWVGYKG
ncbi:hypothetical protein BC938DRAFT_470990, partial [Jimgerdemannia flammicorona]